MSNKLTSKCEYCGTSATMEVYFASDLRHMISADERFRKAHEGCVWAAKRNTPSKIQTCTRPAPHSGPCNGMPCDYVVALLSGEIKFGPQTPRRKSVLPRLWKWIRRLLRD